ncbi:MAG: 2Fe-2S iron-sulfur cluster binding domain-containing protein [Betaproteobacteria bacterium]|nr:MAG: 2Fe-2S iron-sulfur cluster binding domain-containing protein [Betaproteobacteria bacterium]
MTTFRVTRRELRLTTGLVLFAYVSVHLVDHAFGLVSVAVAEHALRLAVAVWHSWPGTALLYGAAGIHIALAFVAVYERRTLRMPPVQALRIALGFAMPLLVIGHVAATRLATELYGLSPTYTRIVWGLWTSDNEGRQLALLAPGWLHGCLGIDFAFGRRALYQRLRPALFGAALLLPVLAGLGFLAMGRELAVLAADPAWLASAEVADTAQRIALGRLRDGLLAGYLVLIGLVFVAREIRAHIERRSKSLVAIAYPQRTVEVPRGWSVLEASRGFGIPHLSMCGGNARCSTCRVRVIAGAANLPPPSDNERRTLERIRAPADVRLACQLRPVADVAVVPLLDATDAVQPGREAPPAVVERDVAVLFIKLVAWKADTHAPQSSHDVVYALDRFLAAIGNAIAEAGGLPGRFDNEGATATFGIATDLEIACRQALVAAAEIERGLADLNADLVRELGFTADYALAIHAGPAAIGYVGYGHHRARTAVGDTVLAAQMLRDVAAASSTRFVVSRAAAAAAGMPTKDIDWRPVAVRGARPTVEITGSERAIRFDSMPSNR